MSHYIKLLTCLCFSDGLDDFCENESFRAQCRDDEVIVMKSASYGRMKLSRCIDRDYGYVGCSADVSLQVRHIKINWPFINEL